MFEPSWRPSRASTILIGIVSIWPILYMCLFMGFIAYSFTSMNRAGGNATHVPEMFPYLFALHLLTMLLMIALTTVYVIHAYRTDLIPNDKKVLWVIILFFGNVIAFPIYWYLYLWRPAGLAGDAPGSVTPA